MVAAVGVITDAQCSSDEDAQSHDSSNDRNHHEGNDLES